MNNFIAKYERILEILKHFETKRNFLNQKRCPRLSDIELIAVDLTAESLSSSRIERSVYNRRRRKLFLIKEKICKALSKKLTENEDYFIIDSMPLEIYKLSR